MAKAEVLPIEPGDVEAVLPIIRQADRDELEEALQLQLSTSLAEGLEQCCKASKIVVNGLIVALFGDSRHDDRLGIPWLVSTVHVERYPREFLKVCKPEVQEMLTRHESLINFVDVRNTVAIRWLEWLGFTFGEPEPYGPLGMPFKPFWLKRST
ncbi:hypothetical protein KXR63_00495 [Stutzerimonas chloritidismutans]|uniref:hypothetical protein n=1 Tax=Stutzerimonas chloritidismutans TaxID=203192 RepID=UPI003F18FF7A